jgi:lysyl-tRNA synthetase, class II
MLETYMAYGDYRTMMDLTEQIMTDAIDAIGGGYTSESSAMSKSTSRLRSQRKTYAELVPNRDGRRSR